MTKKDQAIQKHGYRSWLQQEFVDRCRKNPTYSIRAFAKLLNTNSSSLSQILSGKRNASLKMVTRFSEILGADPELRAAVTLDAKTRQKRSFHDTEEVQFHELAMDAFNVIADWYHYAILELTKIEGFQSEPRWIAKKLHLTTAQVQIAVDRLKRLGLLKEKEDRLVASEAQVTNAGSIETSHAMKQLQKHVLEKALSSIDNTPKERKDITSMTMAVDESKLPQAREMIKKFRRSLCAFVEDGKPSAVFNLGIQLYPLTEENQETADAEL